MRSAASHISKETALCFSGLLKVMMPTRPCRSESIFWVMDRLLVSDRAGGAQGRDLVRRHAELGEDFLVVRPAVGRRRGEP